MSAPVLHALAGHEAYVGITCPGKKRTSCRDTLHQDSAQRASYHNLGTAVRLGGARGHFGCMPQIDLRLTGAATGQDIQTCTCNEPRY